ncbi:MAG: cobalamin biosynthesis protein CobD [Lachnospiraceae bacterium]|nr:cobalamin biosynthesis protein CobD [Lachnospiraceae bacterium]
MNTAYLLRIVIPVLIGFGLDLLVGDPHWLYHPVRLVGKMIEGLEKLLRWVFPESKAGEFAGGMILALFTSEFTAVIVLLLCRGADRLHIVAGILVRTLLCYWLFAVRSLRDESMKVYDALKAGDLPGAREAVSMIVGRDTQKLDTEGVAKAAVETVAENTSDGVIAPMFYMLIGGPALGWFYKAVNTMDSMIGYRNDDYLYFGRFAARMDDVMNFIPARLSALLMILSCRMARLDGKEAWRIFRRDRYNHASPNSAQTEAVMAGALHVQLAGDAWYFGKLHKKKTIGDPLRPVEARDIRRANRLMYVTSFSGLGIFTLIRVITLFFF